MDAPLSEQPEGRAAVKNRGNGVKGAYTGKCVIEGLSVATILFGSEEANETYSGYMTVSDVSCALQRALQASNLDGGSRKDGEGSYNWHL